MCLSILWWSSVENALNGNFQKVSLLHGNIWHSKVYRTSLYCSEASLMSVPGSGYPKFSTGKAGLICKNTQQKEHPHKTRLISMPLFGQKVRWQTQATVVNSPSGDLWIKSQFVTLSPVSFHRGPSTVQGRGSDQQSALPVQNDRGIQGFVHLHPGGVSVREEQHDTLHSQDLRHDWILLDKNLRAIRCKIRETGAESWVVEWSMIYKAQSITFLGTMGILFHKKGVIASMHKLRVQLQPPNKSFVKSRKSRAVTF